MPPSSSSSQSLYNVEIEAHGLSVLLKHPDVWGDFYLINRSDFSEANRPIWDLISLQLSSTPPGSLDPLMMAEKAKGLGLGSLSGGFEIYPYLEGLKTRFIEKKESASLAKELKRLTVRRELIGKAEAVKRELVSTPNASFEEMSGMVEKSLSDISIAYCKPEVTEVFGNLIEVVEKRAGNPLTAESAGYLGPFKSINETISALTYHGSYTVVGSRTGVGKSSFGWFYQTYLLERYPELHLLHLDVGEMTFEELCWRAVCCLSGGEIPYWAVERGEWKKNKKWSAMIHNDLWPRVEKMKDRMAFKNVGGMSHKERIAFQRRYYYNKVGRGNHMLIHDDYLKAAESSSKITQEHQSMGYYVGDQKTLITEEIIASLWTSVQDNRGGIITGKKVDDIQDSEGNYSLSDRIIQQSTHGFGLRFKVPEELSRELNLFGNMKLELFKKRKLLGEKYLDLILPVKMDNGRFRANYFNINAKDFWYQDKGTFKDMLEVLGKSPTNMNDGHGQSAKPL